MMLACCSHGANVPASSSSLSLFSQTGSSSIVLPTQSTFSEAAIITLQIPRSRERDGKGGRTQSLEL